MTEDQKKTKLIKQHYQNEDIKYIIIRCSTFGDIAFRCLNGDFKHWYKPKGENVTLYDGSNKRDYDRVTRKYRTLYWSLNQFHPKVRYMEIPKNLHDKKGNKISIGNFSNTITLSPGVDIDSVGDIRKPEIKEAVEAMGQFYCTKLMEYCPKSVYACFSGGGIYVYIHHGIFGDKFQNDEIAWRRLTGSYNTYIKELEGQFFEKYPQYKGKTKADAGNNQKRLFKTIFSVHKDLLFAVIPLDINHIHIDFKKATLPLSQEIINEGKKWMWKYDKKEAPTLMAMLEEYETTDILIPDDEPISVPKFHKTVPFKYFPPCMKKIINEKKSKDEIKVEGATRKKTFVVIGLGQAGYPAADASNIFDKVSERLGGPKSNIFESWFRIMRFPSCKKIQTKGAAYPSLFMGELGVCQPDEICRYINNPYDYMKKAIEFGPGDITLKDVHRVVKKWLYIDDTDRIDVILASALSNKIDGTAIWMYIVGGSGDLKSTLVRTLEGLPNCRVYDQITKHTLASGLKGIKDEGYYLQKKSTVIVVPDMASLTSQRSDDKNIIWAQMRNLYDEFIEKRTGSGVMKRYNGCHVTLVAGTTTKIRDEILIHAQLGTRELMYDTAADPIDNNEKMDKAWENEEYEKQMKKELGKVVTEFLVQRPIKKINISPQIKRWLKKEAERLTILRAGGMTDRYDCELMNPVSPEIPTRVIKQFKRLYICLKSLDDNYSDDRCKKIITHVVNSSGNKVRQIILDVLKNAETELNLSEIHQRTKIGRRALKSQLEQLWSLDVVKKDIIEERVGAYVVTTKYGEQLRGGRVMEVAYYSLKKRKPLKVSKDEKDDNEEINEKFTDG